MAAADISSFHRRYISVFAQGLFDATLMGVSWHQYATLLVLILYTCHDKGAYLCTHFFFL
jgi:hypothetical protein